MNKSDLVQAAVDASGLPPLKVQEVLESCLDSILLSLACGESVTIRDFGRFEPRERPARTALNPKTQEKVEVPPTRSVAFLASPGMKKRLNR